MFKVISWDGNTCPICKKSAPWGYCDHCGWTAN